MTDNVCHSIVKIGVQQILQSAGFEAANSHSIDTLADVFGKYIELLGSKVSAYANLNGRTIGNAFDLMKAMNEVDIEPKKLKAWLEEEGKSLTPCWSAQSDPGRLIQGVINGGRPNFEDMIEYRFGDDIHEYDIPSPPTSPTIESLPSPLQDTATTLPDYIPSYFPPFPEIKEDEVMEEADKVLFQRQQQLLQQKKEQEELKQQQEQQALPLPLLVKNRKKPIENPFTHIIPFEDSSLATDNEDGTQQQALSLLVNINSRRKRSEEEEEELINKRRKVATASLMDALVNVKTPAYKLGEGVVRKDDELFRAQTQNAAAPGNYLFNHDIGVFDEVVRKIADPMVIAKLTAPNLQTDIAMITSLNSTPATPTTTTPSMNGLGGMTFHEMRSSPGPTSPENGLPRSSSMLQALAGGSASSSKKKYNKLYSSHTSSHIPSKPMSLNALSNHTISKHSVDINAIKTGDSKYIIKKKRMLAEKQQREQQEKELANKQSLSSEPLPSNNAPVTNTTITHAPSSTAAKQNGSTNGPISLSSFSSAAASTSSLPSSSSTAAPSTSATKTHNGNPITVEKEKKKKEHKEHKSKGPKLMLNFSSLPQPNLTEDVSSPSTPSTPKIRFKIKPPPEQQQQPSANSGSSSSNIGMNNSSIKLHQSSSPKVPKPKPTTTITLQQYQQQQQHQRSSENYTVPIKLEKQHQSMLSSPIPRPVPQQQSNFSIVHNNGYSAEEIRCICENPTVDYGTFMIACDKCSVWFHGSCVGIAESDQVEEWYCKRCRGLK